MDLISSIIVGAITCMVTWTINLLCISTSIWGLLPPSSSCIMNTTKSNPWIHHLSDPNTDQYKRVHRSDHYLIPPSLIVGLMTSCYWFYFEFEALFFDRSNPQYSKSPSFQGPLLWSWHTLLTSFYDYGTPFFEYPLFPRKSRKTLPTNALHKRESTTTYHVNSHDNYA